MNITINNNTTIIADLDAATIAILCERLSFTDKSKEYQIRRLSKSIWGKTSQHLKQLQSEVDQCLVTVLSDDSVSIPTEIIQMNVDYADFMEQMGLSLYKMYCGLWATRYIEETWQIGIVRSVIINDSI